MQDLIKNKIVKDYILESKNDIQYTVPYRPRTNAIETFFSIFKHYMIQEQGNTLSYNDIKNTIEKAISNIMSHFFILLQF